MPVCLVSCTCTRVLLWYSLTVHKCRWKTNTKTNRDVTVSPFSYFKKLLCGHATPSPLLEKSVQQVLKTAIPVVLSILHWQEGHSLNFWNKSL